MGRDTELKILGLPFIIFATDKASNFKFGTQPGLVKAHEHSQRTWASGNQFEFQPYFGINLSHL